MSRSGSLTVTEYHMTSRFLAAAVAVAAAVAPAAAQSKGPALTFQSQPVGKIVDAVKTFARSFGGEPAVADMERQFKEQLGEKGFAGVDTARPIVGYSELNDKAEASGVVVVAPITGEAEFLDFLKRAKITVEEVSGSKGVYKLTPRENANPDKAPTRLRFKGKDAYLAVNVPEASFTADKLVDPAGLADPKETALIAYRLHIARIPEGLKKQGYEALDKAVADLKDLTGGGPQEMAAKAAGAAFAKLLKRMGDQVLSDGDTAAFRVRFDPKATEGALELALVPKKGTALAKDIAARKPTTNRFAGLVTKDAAAGLLFQAPLFAPEVRDLVAGGLELAQQQAGPGVPEPYQPLFTEAVQGAVRTVKSGELDLGAALSGPDQDGLYNVALGLSFADPSGVEKALRAALKSGDPGVKALIQLDAGKVGDVSVHRVTVGPFLPPEAQKVFGENAALFVAFAPKGVYLAFGQAGMDVITAALKGEPAPAKVLDVVVNPKRLHTLVQAFNPEQAKQVAGVLGTEDRTGSALSASVEGGAELRVRVALNLKLLPRGKAGEKK